MMGGGGEKKCRRQMKWKTYTTKQARGQRRITVLEGAARIGRGRKRTSFSMERKQTLVGRGRRR